jgi:D-alanine-D-alanine ligase
MKRVAVLRGGPSEEYSVSMLSGNAVLKALRDSDYPHKDIVITKKGEWLEEGFVKSPEQALEAVDVVFVALHGSYGEDGQVQRILQRKGIPFTGSRALSSAVAFNKELAKNTMRPH